MTEDPEHSLPEQRHFRLRRAMSLFEECTKMITEYHFGGITVGNRTYRDDIKVIEGRVVSRWWRKEGHLVEVEDVMDVLLASPDVLVIGMGQPGRMIVAESLRSILSDRGIELIELPTDQAVKTFNSLSGMGKKVAAAIHLTC